MNRVRMEIYCAAAGWCWIVDGVASKPYSSKWNAKQGLERFIGRIYDCVDKHGIIAMTKDL